MNSPDKVAYYLELVGLPVLMLAPILGVAFFVLIPARIRLDLAIVATFLWLTLGELIGLGMIQAVAKATGFAAYLMLIAVALMEPGPKRRVPPIAWLYIATGLQAFIYIMTVSNFPQALAVRVQWLLLVIAAIAVARTIVDEASLKRILIAVAMGYAVGLFLPFSELLLNPAAAFKATGRFNPYDSNPNHIGIVFGLTPPLAAYAALQVRSKSKKVWWLGSAAIALGCGLLTASRSTMAMMIGIGFPLALAWIKRPALAFLGALALMGGVLLASFFVETVSWERFTPEAIMESGRIQSLADHPYWPIIEERPLFGVLETEGESFLRSDQELMGHPHNAYWELLYFGGFTYGIPMIFLAAYTLWCVYGVWRVRMTIQADPLLVNMAIALMVMTYAHGFVNHAIHYPTTTLAFVHVWLSVVFIGFAHNLANGEPIFEPAVGEHEDWRYDEPYDDSDVQAA
jgi:hypothetical protein